MFFLFFFLIFLTFPQKVTAADEFTLHHQLTYTINPQGRATVRHQIELANNFSQIYAQKYLIQLSGSKLENIVGADETGDIVSAIDQNNDYVTIHLTFKDPAIGKNQTKKFTLTYDIVDFAVPKGKTWEILLPQMNSSNPSDQKEVTLLIPQQFGRLSYSSIPIKDTVTSQQSYYLINLQSSQVDSQKVLLVFGDYQLFDFHLSFELDNDSPDRIATEIAIPPDTTTQTVTYTQISPRPISITTDTDGNWLAQYHLDPYKKTTVTVTGQVKITPDSFPQQPIDPSTYLLPQTYWPVNQPQIQQTASTLNSAGQIYRYVVDTLDYNYNLINAASRKGALPALNHPQDALCTEFTDLFVTLSRASGIPAREIEGYAFSNNLSIKPINVNADVLHAWPQYYDSSKQAWVSIDPTWEDTTNGIDYFHDLDLNHFTFVIHGQDSRYPPPPGAYKSDPNTKTVSVNFAQDQINPSFDSPQLSLTKTNPFRPRLIVRNPNLNSLRRLQLSLPQQDWSHQLNYLPPLGKTEIDLPPIPFVRSLLPQNQKLSFQIQFDNARDIINYSVLYLPHYLNLAISIGAAIIILSFFGLSLTLKKRNEKNT